MMRRIAILAIAISACGREDAAHRAGRADAAPPCNTTPAQAAPPGSAVDLGPNVLVLDPSSANAQALVSAIFSRMETNQFGDERHAILLKPGTYDLDVRLGYYTQVMGLGASPDDVLVNGGVRVDAAWMGSNATLNFWRGAENLSVRPTQDGGVVKWAVSQDTWVRRAHVRGPMDLWDFDDDGNHWASGGFIADSVIDGVLNSGSQQQFLTRNTRMGSWQGGSWNMVFVGDQGAPTSNWPSNSYSVVGATPRIREKPYMVAGASGYSIMVPPLRANAVGPSWPNDGAAAVPLAAFYVARSDRDTAETMNAALDSGQHLLLTPGVYSTDAVVHVSRPGTIVYGLGLATLRPMAGNVAIQVDDVDGVTLAGILLDAGPQKSPALLQLGTQKTAIGHAQAPTALFDVACRVGGAQANYTAVDTCIQVFSADVIIDQSWLWRADHGNNTGWGDNPAAHGITVQGDGVTTYGLFVEHFQGYQTEWFGNGGSTYFYQSELPYDVPNQGAWMANGENGYASYKVVNAVASHSAMGLGVYAVFSNGGVWLDNAIEASSAARMQHMTTTSLNQGGIHHVFNGDGGQVGDGTQRAATSY